MPASPTRNEVDGVRGLLRHRVKALLGRVESHAEHILGIGLKPSQLGPAPRLVRSTDKAWSRLAYCAIDRSPPWNTKSAGVPLRRLNRSIAPSSSTSGRSARSERAPSGRTLAAEQNQESSACLRRTAIRRSPPASKRDPVCKNRRRSKLAMRSTCAQSCNGPRGWLIRVHILNTLPLNGTGSFWRTPGQSLTERSSERSYSGQRFSRTVCQSTSIPRQRFSRTVCQSTSIPRPGREESVVSWPSDRERLASNRELVIVPGPINRPEKRSTSIARHATTRWAIAAEADIPFQVRSDRGRQPVRRPHTRRSRAIYRCRRSSPDRR